MTEEWPDHLDDRGEYDAWVDRLAANALRSASGQAADAAETGDLADTTEARIESEVELEVGDKIDVLATQRTPFDVLRFTEQTPTTDVIERIDPSEQVYEVAVKLAYDALYQDVLAVARTELEAPTSN